MSTFVIHLLIPPVMALAARYVPFRDVWTWMWVGAVSDVDYIGWIASVHWGWPNFHRALLHNVFLLIGLAVFGWRRWRAYARSLGLPSFQEFLQTRRGAAAVLIPYFYATHLVLDAFQGGFVPFWPVSTYNVGWDFQLDVDTKTNKPVIYSEPVVGPDVPDVSPQYTWLTGEELAFTILFAICFLGGLWLHVQGKRREAAVMAAAGPEGPTSHP